ncbi:monovalent cation/H+ antiporter subunit D family protein [Janibacter sp. YIM B02568]|uniref:monovalent cation/H+ antiporter subunit D family protein n=1 Tax=Janibacter endophyticus TaxID=2806261 RepID=UPI0019520A06|nr:monovalent cation/H+ antiporter subunit D family protein [Janibacter endophyticus]MBM6547228.1 monovalent cation/H+ antiporter subunit D family protein [Janibacter endophyticus]
MTAASALPLLVAVPLGLAGLTVIVRRHVVGVALLLATLVGTLVASALLVRHHAEVPALATGVGGYAPGVAIPFVSDTLTAVMLAVTSLATLATTAWLVLTGETRYRFFVPLVLLLMTGVYGALLTGDLFNLFVFVEVMLLPSYALIAVTGTWRRLGVGRLFVVVNLVTSAILLMGVGLVYGTAGTVNIAALAGQGSADGRSGLAVGIVLLALGIKAGVVPVHTWLPRSYPATSPGVMSLFAALHTKVALYAIYRIVSVIYDGQVPWVSVLVVVVVLTCLVGSLSTFGEQTFRHAMAYQMVAGVGHILIGVVVFTQVSLAGGLLYLVHHVITMGGLLLTGGAIEHTYGSQRFDRLAGLMRREPWAAAAVALGLLSLVGLPPTSGLWGKLGLVIGAADAPGWQAWALIGAVVAASILSIMALQRVWAEIFWGPPMERYRTDNAQTRLSEPVPLPDEVRIPLRLLLPGAALIALSVAIFIGIGVLDPVIDRAAAGLVDPAPYVEAVLR